jgi:hypothetical protein
MGYWAISADFLKRVLHKYLVLISVRLSAIMGDYCRGFPQYRQATAKIFLSDYDRSKFWTQLTSKAKLIWTKTTTHKSSAPHGLN